MIWTGYQDELVFNHRRESQHAHFCSYYHPLHGFAWALYLNGLNEGKRGAPTAFISRHTIGAITHDAAVEGRHIRSKLTRGKESQRGDKDQG